MEAADLDEMQAEALLATDFAPGMLELLRERLSATWARTHKRARKPTPPIAGTVPRRLREDRGRVHFTAVDAPVHKAT